MAPAQGLFTPKFREHDMKTILKRILIQLYCLGLIDGSTVIRVFKRFDLWSA